MGISTTDKVDFYLSSVDENKIGGFTDVKSNAYYAPYVNWAIKNSIIDGTSATTFSPDQSITRQEMAVFMQNYIKSIGYITPKTRELVTFADSENVAAWAANSVKSMQMAGIIVGKDGNKFDPNGTATRAEFSALLHRYVELTIDNSTAQGLEKNDSGSVTLYENGKAVKGQKRDVDGSTYNFNGDGEATV